MATATLLRTDEEIQKDVMAELKWDAKLQPNEIGVIVKDGVVTLTGWVDSYLKKWSAEDAVHRVTGVRRWPTTLRSSSLSSGRTPTLLRRRFAPLNGTPLFPPRR